MFLQITTLVENAKGEHLALLNEHGLSFYITYKDSTVLFDTGQSKAFIHNAEQLQLDLSLIEHVVLSHGHYDHSGGFTSLIEYLEQDQAKKDLKLWVGNGFFQDKYAYKNNTYEYLGNNFSQLYLNSHQINYEIVTANIMQICPDIYIVTNFPRIHPEEEINPRFLLKTPQGFIPDPFNDEVLIAINTPKGVVAVLGCSHPGMRNMLDSVKKQFQKPIYAVLGGTHLVEADGPCLSQSIEYLHHDTLQLVGVSHCTGQKAMARMSETNSRYYHNRTGSSLFIEL